jgi:UDP-N-acetylmuramate dehydrogenase
MRAESDVPLAPLTTLGVGGSARRLVTVEAAGELPEALASPAPVLFLAGGSNVVLPDAGWPAGTVVRLATRGVRHEDGPGGAVRLVAAAGEPWEPLVAAAVGDGLVGLEALSGIPGSTGATPIQNVGAYGQEVAQTVAAVRVWDRAEERERALTPADCRFAYRSSALKGQDRLIVTEVAFDLERGERGAPVAYAELARTLGIEIGERAPLGAVREVVLGLRRRKGMVLDPGDPDTASAGSFFTNPLLDPPGFAILGDRVEQRLGPGAHPPEFPGEDGRVKTSAAWLIERAGFSRGHRCGGAALSGKHTLAITNRGGATAADVLALAREIRDGVHEAFGVELVPEPVIVGASL